MGANLSADLSASFLFLPDTKAVLAILKSDPSTESFSSRYLTVSAKKENISIFLFEFSFLISDIFLKNSSNFISLFFSFSAMIIASFSISFS